MALRPHLKTAKSVDVARRVMNSPAGPATVSTLREAEQFVAAGVRDIIYAVGIAPSKLPQVLALRAKGADVAVVLDTVEQAQAVALASCAAGMRIPALIEIDCDGNRSGVRPDDKQFLVEIGRALAAGAELRGVLTHAGGSYTARGPEALQQCAEAERRSVVDAATILREAGLACHVLSVGSTPTAHSAADLAGVTEVRAGVFVFFDLVMAGIGVCRVEDIAVTVLATVIGHQREKGWILIDAGWMAMSQDRGTRKQEVDQGYGLVCDITGKPYFDLSVADANQEHGIITVRLRARGRRRRDRHRAVVAVWRRTCFCRDDHRRESRARPGLRCQADGRAAYGSASSHHHAELDGSRPRAVRTARFRHRRCHPTGPGPSNATP